MLSLMPSDLLICPIRHHGPGSARRTLDLLAEWQPDYLLIEGPPEASDLLFWLDDEAMEPPLALLVYRPDVPQQAAYFPYALYSPEYQAVRYGLKAGIPVRFADLPMRYRLALGQDLPMPGDEAMKQFAQATGYPTYESWWDAHFEQRQDQSAAADAIIAMMATIRAEVEPSAGDTDPAALTPERFNEWREHFMRQAIVQARAEGYQRIAFVVGAWHSPALTEELPLATTAFPSTQVTVSATWIPWTYSRLSVYGGYGAGVRAPGWYHHLWQRYSDDLTTQSIHWLNQVAQLLREADLDASPAHLIEAVRLAESLAALRGRARPGLNELTEATQTVLCQGETGPLRLIQTQLIIGERLGRVPDGLPLTPLQRDLQAEQKRLNLRPQPEPSTLSLDLRQEKHWERSHLLHRLNLLDIAWGKPVALRGQQGTYREVWQLQWQPHLALAVISASLWGNTVLDAATAWAKDQAEKMTDLPTLTGLVDQIILADLPDLLEPLLQRLDDAAALSGDVLHLMAALPPLAQVLRYGNLRQTARPAIRQVVNGLLTRIAINLPRACTGLADDAAAELFEPLISTHHVVNSLDDESRSQQWRATLRQLLQGHGVHGLLSGRACRLLFDARALDQAEFKQQLTQNLVVSAMLSATHQAQWLEGLLKGSGLLLLHDRLLWQLVNEWVVGLAEEHFIAVLPLLRRTFASFNEGERRQMGEQVQRGAERARPQLPLTPRFDAARARQVIPLLEKLLSP